MSKLVPDDGVKNHNFASSLALTQSGAVIGALGDDELEVGAGAAYIARETSEGTWEIVQKLFASDGGREDRFGSGAAMLPQTTFVGAMTHGFAGAAYVFEPDEEGIWRQTQKLTPTGATLGAQFGDDLSVDGDVLVVGARFTFVRFGSAGAAFVFERDESGSWEQVAKLVAPDPSSSDFFGIGVGVSGGVAVIGASNDDDRGSNAGAAYVFERGEDGVWRHVLKLLAADGEAGDELGRFVAVDGDRILIGANRDNDNGNASGSAYFFERDDKGAWVQTAKILPADGHEDQRFGYSPVLHGSRALVGAFLDDERGNKAGAAYVFELTDDGTWVQRAKLTAADADEDDWFGQRLAMSGDTVVIGARQDEENGNESGSAYVFDFAPLTPDLDGDGDVDLDDYALFASCLTGPEGGVRAICTAANLDCDNDVDLHDFTKLQIAIR